MLGEPRGEAVTRDGRRIKLYKLEICTEAGCEEIQGVYGSTEFDSENTISIIPRRNKVEIGYGAYGKSRLSPPTILSAYKITGSGERVPLYYAEIAPGEELKIYVHRTYRETGKLSGDTSIVSKAILRIGVAEPLEELEKRAAELLKELEKLKNQLYTGTDFKKYKK